MVTGAAVEQASGAGVEPSGRALGAPEVDPRPTAGAVDIEGLGLRSRFGVQSGRLFLNFFNFFFSLLAMIPRSVQRRPQR
jgi:hypothetical protein